MIEDEGTGSEGSTDPEVTEDDKPKRPRGRPRKTAAVAPKPKGYVVAPGKAITTPRGMKVAGDVVELVDITGGQDSFDALVEAGVLVPG